MAKTSKQKSITKYFDEIEVEAQQIIANWKDGIKCDLSDIPDSLLRVVERLVRDDRSSEGHSLSKEAEYAWYQKYGGSDNYCGGY